MFYDADETLYTSEYKVSMLVRLRGWCACEPAKCPRAESAPTDNDVSRGVRQNEIPILYSDLAANRLKP